MQPYGRHFPLYSRLPGPPPHRGHVETEQVGFKKKNDDENINTVKLERSPLIIISFHAAFSNGTSTFMFGSSVCAWTISFFSSIFRQYAVFDEDY